MIFFRVLLALLLLAGGLVSLSPRFTGYARSAFRQLAAGPPPAAAPRPPLGFLKEGGRVWGELSARERAAIRAARAAVADGGDRAAALRDVIAAVEHRTPRYFAAKELTGLAGDGIAPDEAVEFAQLALDLAPGETTRLEAREALGNVQLAAGREDAAAETFLGLPSARPAGPDAARIQEWNYRKARGLIEAGRVEAGMLDYLSRAPRDPAGREQFLLWSGRLVTRAVAADPVLGTRFQVEVLEKAGLNDPDEIRNAAARLDAAGQTEPADGIRKLLLDRFPQTSAAARAAVVLAERAARDGRRDEAARLARLVRANPAADRNDLREVQDYLSVQELLGGPAPDLKPQPDPAFSTEGGN